MAWMTAEAFPPTVFTIGHSNHPIESFIGLLTRHKVARVADVRSYPGSRWAPQFGGKVLKSSLAVHGLDYVWLGTALGGKRDTPALTKPEGKPDYTKIAALDDFRAAIATLAADVASRRVALLCAEGDPMRCHRKHLVGKALRAEGFTVAHILRDGALVTDDELEKRDALPLFEALEKETA
jgi:uncharacterized protein (DUF488 family)